MKISEIRETLRKIIAGDVLWEKEIIQYYSVDASSYQILPKVVIIPKDETDVISAIKFANKAKISVTVRGAGTGLVGSALNDGIVLDLRRFDSIKIGKNFAMVQPGVFKGMLDKKLKEKKKFFPPNPSVGAFCAIGGMIGNNSSGSRSLKYGSMIDNIQEITFVNGRGEKIILPKDGKVAKKIVNISKCIDIKRFPHSSKNSSGYRLDSSQSVKESHKAIVGSEGTLGIVLSAKLKIKEIPEKRVLFILEYQSLTSAANDCRNILATAPSAIEFVDKITLRQIPEKFNKKTSCLLFVEYDSEIKEKIRALKNTNHNICKQISKDSEIQKWWKYRDSSLYYSLKSIKKKNRIPHVIEDASVPLERLGELFEIIEELNRKFSTKVIMYGHAGNANIHVRLVADRKNIRKIKDIAKFYFERVIAMKGTITAEHGDGLARSEFVKTQYGQKNYRAFKEIKAYLDPNNILNPGKIIASKSTILKNLENFENN